MRGGRRILTPAVRPGRGRRGGRDRARRPVQRVLALDLHQQRGLRHRRRRGRATLGRFGADRGHVCAFHLPLVVMVFAAAWDRLRAWRAWRLDLDLWLWLGAALGVGRGRVPVLRSLLAAGAAAGRAAGHPVAIRLSARLRPWLRPHRAARGGVRRVRVRPRRVPRPAGPRAARDLRGRAHRAGRHRVRVGELPGGLLAGGPAARRRARAQRLRDRAVRWPRAGPGPARTPPPAPRRCCSTTSGTTRRRSCWTRRRPTCGGTARTRCRTSRAIDAYVRDHYRKVTTVDGVDVWVLR